MRNRNGSRLYLPVFALLGLGSGILPACSQFTPLNPGECLNGSLSSDDGILQDTGTRVDIYTLLWVGGPLTIHVDSPDFDEALLIFSGPGPGTSVDSSTSDPEIFFLSNAPFGNYTIYATSKAGGGLVTGNYTVCALMGTSATATPTSTLVPTHTHTVPAPTSTPTDTPAPPSPTRTSTVPQPTPTRTATLPVSTRTRTPTFPTLTRTPTPPGNPSYHSRDLLRLIDGAKQAGCDLNGDGRTDLVDVLIAAQQGFDFCGFNESVDINNNPNDDVVMVIGHSPEDTIVRGTKDPEGNLIDITSLEINDAEDGMMDVFFDEMGRPLMVGLGPDSIQASFVSDTIFDFTGSIDGQPVNGTADLSRVPPELIEEFVGEGGLKGRTYVEALNACANDVLVIARNRFNCSDFSCRVGLLYMMAVFLTGNTLSCDCLVTSFDDPDNIHVKRIKGYQILINNFMDRIKRIIGVLEKCDRFGNPYNCSAEAKANLRAMEASYSDAIIFVSTMANQEFDALASGISSCRQDASPTPTKTDTVTSTPTETETQTTTVTPTETGTTVETPTPTGSATETPTVSPTGSITGTATITPTPTATSATRDNIRVTLTWSLNNIYMTLYVVEPNGEVAWYEHTDTASGGHLEEDESEENSTYRLSAFEGDIVTPGTYSIRVHYAIDFSENEVTPARTVRWFINILLDEGTPHQRTENYTGTLSVADFANNIPGSSGPDWAIATDLNYSLPPP
ncbi:MAG: hypothetical protein HUU16_10460 [Candidatus Omnitrophica bacterium]|nr:hypothetical protein [bacterium]NUN96583.1 hypothetical protein [Candidatus Omnitrophota bacterium]